MSAAPLNLSAVRVSTFAHAQATRPLDRPLSDILSDIREGTHRAAIEPIREALGAGDVSRAKALKRSLPGFTAAGTFRKRANDALSASSGLIVADIDGLTGAQLADISFAVDIDPHAVAGFVSPSGTGYKILYRTDPGRPHADAFAAMRAHVRATHYVDVDPACRDVARLCFVSFDPELHDNPDAIPLPPAPPEPEPGAADDEFEALSARVGKPSRETVAALLDYIPPRPEYPEWVRIIAAVCDALPPDEACEVLDAWSPEEVAGEYREKCANRLASVTVGTLFHLAGRHAPQRVATLKARAVGWDTPAPLELHEPPPPLDYARIFPPGLSELREFCEAVQESLQVPSDSVPPLALALASIGTSRAIELELGPQWRETAPLWVSVLAHPGERKSALLGLLGKPVHDWQSEQRQSLAPALAKHREERRTEERKLKQLREEIKKRKKPEESNQLERKVQESAAALEMIPDLVAPELITSNATPEAIRDMLARNGEKVALVSAETDAGQLLGSRYANGGVANIDLFLAAYTGDPAPSHRVGKDVPLLHPALALVLCVQPEAVLKVIGNEEARGRGLVDRMALIHPPSRMGTRKTNPEPVPPSLLAWWGRTLQRLLDQPWPGRVMLTFEGLKQAEDPPHLMRLSSDAKRIFDILREYIESRIGEDGDLRPIAGFASKLPGLVARIALTMQAMQKINSEKITSDTMQAAVAWAPPLLGHFRAVLGNAAERPERKLARRLLTSLKRKKVPEISARDALRMVDGNGLSMTELDPALTVLVEHGWIRPIQALKSPKQGRPPSPRYAIHPEALATNGEQG